MNTTPRWDGWIQDNSKAPHEAISQAIEMTEEALSALRNLRPESLLKVGEQINKAVDEGLQTYLNEVLVYPSTEPGVIHLSIADDLEKDFTLEDFANEIASDFAAEHDREAWAKKFDEAAAIIRAKAAN